MLLYKPDSKVVYMLVYLLVLKIKILRKILRKILSQLKFSLNKRLLKPHKISIGNP